MVTLNYMYLLGSTLVYRPAAIIYFVGRCLSPYLTHYNIIDEGHRHSVDNLKVVFYSGC